MEPDTVLDGVVVEALDGGLDEADAAVVAEVADVLGEALDAVEGRAVADAGLDDEFGRLEERRLGAEVREREGDRLAVVAVGGVADQRGAGVGVGLDDHSDE